MKALLNFLLSIPSTLFGGYIFAQMWNWFLVRKFPSVPTLNFLDAVGLLLVFSFPLLGLFWADVIKESKKDKSDKDQATITVIASIIKLVLVYPIILGTAYLWHLVVG